MKIHIQTDRLIIRDLEESDAADIFELDSDPEVHEFLGKQPISTMDEARRIIDSVRQQYVDNGIGRWAIIDKSTEDFIGWTGLKYETKVRVSFDYYDLGYRLKKKYWGKGIATESAIESLKYGFERMELKEIGAAAEIRHLVSNRILTNIGFEQIETFEFDGVACNWYNLKKGEWVSG